MEQDVDIPWEFYALCVAISIVVWLRFKLTAEKKRVDELTKDMAQLVAKNTMLEAEHLKFQLQPHTLNNILANLRSIASRLHNGMEALSETLDYILYKGNAHLVSVESELDFVKRYLALNDLFLSEIEAVKLDDSEVNKRGKHYDSPCVPHLITAYFIENAFKHGDINHPEFLRIKVKLTDALFELHVVNKIGRFNMRKSSGGIGQRNMQKRLDLLLPGKSEIKFSCNEEEYHSILRLVLI